MEVDAAVQGHQAFLPAEEEVGWGGCASSHMDKAIWYCCPANVQHSMPRRETYVLEEEGGWARVSMRTTTVN